MLLRSSSYTDSISGVVYSINSNLDFSKDETYIITGENGVGKSRFIEGILLKELKHNGENILYFSQDVENQILSFELISLVKNFINILKKSGTFLKTIFLNDESHNSIELDFNSNGVLHPTPQDIKNFVVKECLHNKNISIVIFDEIDKYFSNKDEFIQLLKETKIKKKIIISHEISEFPAIKYNRIILEKKKDGVLVNFNSK